MIQVIILVLVFMFIKSDDIPNNQRVHVELIEVSNDYFSLDENLNLPTKMRSDAHFRQVNNDVYGKKVVGGGKKPGGKGKQGAGRGKKASDMGNKGTGGGNKPTGRGKKAEHNLLNVSGSFFVSPSLPEDDIEDGYVSE